MDKLFDNKRTYTGYDGEEYINMSIPVVNMNKLQSSSSVTLNQDENARLDTMVWESVSKNMNMIDIVMYANHIFNPFAVKEGDKLFIPFDDDSVYENTSEPSLPDGTKHSNNSKGEKTRSYAENIEYLARMGLGVK